MDPIPKDGINVSLQCFRVGNMERSRNYLIDFFKNIKLVTSVIMMVYRTSIYYLNYEIMKRDDS